MPRKGRRAKGDCYLRGLMLDGRRKSIQAMAARLPDGNEQNLQQLVNQSTWDPVPVQRRINETPPVAGQPDSLSDRRRVGAQGRPDVGRRGSVVLRSLGQTRQLPGGGQCSRGL
jgi:SRSO17 transposase